MLLTTLFSNSKRKFQSVNKMCDSGFQDSWTKACVHCKIPHDIAERWLNVIRTKYNTESHRFYHNSNILNEKCKFLLSLDSSVQFSDYLIFALAFQYYHFDLKSDCCELNCTAFRQFFEETGIDDVSIGISNQNYYTTF